MQSDEPVNSKYMIKESMMLDSNMGLEQTAWDSEVKNLKKIELVWRPEPYLYLSEDTKGPSSFVESQNSRSKDALLKILSV